MKQTIYVLIRNTSALAFAYALVALDAKLQPAANAKTRSSDTRHT